MEFEEAPHTAKNGMVKNDRNRRKGGRKLNMI